MKELAGRVQIVKEKLKYPNREPTINEIANELGCQPEEIVHAMEASRMPSFMMLSMKMKIIQYF